ncbi:hypothetical protein AS9A_0324 [Hoyosella subflava DQS3-9A1]|uniref:Uncharacterized protein n=1 Tax=Hoyosella subflava (strain DSM 45089 / JCM 17490 / NBRC 109087 / DQS3-9A1) TaxID=443218 RepID=F6EGV9_HOYSD|nr:hypothetical protein AS9A_0324 [Hoyosella subflava DQS3-9A1]
MCRPATKARRSSGFAAKHWIEHPDGREPARFDGCLAATRSCAGDEVWT